jgi:hypothetical protein
MKRAELYKAAIAAMLKVHSSNHTNDAALRRLPDFLHELSYALQTRRMRFFGTKFLRRVFSPWEARYKNVWDEFLLPDISESRFSLIIGSEFADSGIPHLFCFSHSSIQEYLCASHLVNGSMGAIVQRSMDLCEEFAAETGIHDIESLLGSGQDIVVQMCRELLYHDELMSKDLADCFLGTSSYAIRVSNNLNTKTAISTLFSLVSCRKQGTIELQ